MPLFQVSWEVLWGLGYCFCRAPHSLQDGICWIPALSFAIEIITKYHFLVHILGLDNNKEMDPQHRRKSCKNENVIRQNQRPTGDSLLFNFPAGQLSRQRNHPSPNIPNTISTKFSFIIINLYSFLILGIKCWHFFKLFWALKFILQFSFNFFYLKHDF